MLRLSRLCRQSVVDGSADRMVSGDRWTVKDIQQQKE